MSNKQTFPSIILQARKWGYRTKAFCTSMGICHKCMQCKEALKVRVKDTTNRIWKNYKILKILRNGTV